MTDSPQPTVTAFPLRPAVIAIDGPAASGKSTVGHQLAERLNFLFFDTGVMYRTVTYAALAAAVPIDDAAALTQVAETIRIDLRPPTAEQADGRQITVLIDGQDVTWQIRSSEVERHVSPVAACAGVRRALSAHQRRIGQHYGAGNAEKPGIVMMGRDIGTVVMPEAPLKIYLDASAAERARRRSLELQQRGKEADFATILADIERRDQIDSQRALAPLRAADDAVIIDTSHLTPAQVVENILNRLNLE